VFFPSHMRHGTMTVSLLLERSLFEAHLKLHSQAENLMATVCMAAQAAHSTVVKGLMQDVPQQSCIMPATSIADQVGKSCCLVWSSTSVPCVLKRVGRQGLVDGDQDSHALVPVHSDSAALSPAYDPISDPLASGTIGPQGSQHYMWHTLLPTQCLPSQHRPESLARPACTWLPSDGPVNSKPASTQAPLSSTAHHFP
jgi:hypothetical protein